MTHDAICAFWHVFGNGWGVMSDVSAKLENVARMDEGWPALTYHELKALEPCKDDFARVTKLMGGAKKWGGKKISAARARKAGASFNDIVWAASVMAKKNKDVERRIRLWLADCAARVLHMYEANTKADYRPRDAIIASRAFARGEASTAAWSAARDAARSAAWEAARSATWEAAWAAAWSAAWAAAWAAAWEAAREVARSAAWEAAWAAAWSAEESWQFDRLIEWLSDKEPNDWPLPKKVIK